MQKNETLETALLRFEETGRTLIPIVDKKGRYTGQCASRAHLFRLIHGLLRPSRIGGLATPLGVYMTTGVHSAGPGWKGLAATGALFAVVAYAMDWISLILFSLVAAVWPKLLVLHEGHQILLLWGFSIATVLGTLRLSPIAGLHAAEHMTINAIEAELDLEPETVRLQPREHSRCGTNLMALMAGFTVGGIFISTAMHSLSPVGLMLYAATWTAIVLRFWRPTGLWLQRHFTTRTPTDPQLASGLRAGRELLAKFTENPHPSPGILQRIWAAGILQMLAAFSVTFWLIDLLASRLGL